MGQDRWADLVDRLTSRKFLLCVLMIALALIGFWSGNLTYRELQMAALTAAGVYSASNAVETIATRPVAPTVNVETPATPLPGPGRFTAEQVSQLTLALEQHRRDEPAERMTGPVAR